MAGGLLVGCSFDNKGVGPDGQTPDAALAGDAQGPTDGAGGEADASPCGGEAVGLALAIDGQAADLPAGSPVQVDVLVGDEVTLSAAGSCVAAGTLAYQWQITPDEGTAAPGLDGEAVAFYPEAVGTYTVDLTVGDGMGGEVTVQIEVEAHGWQAVEVAEGNTNVTDIRDVDVSDEDLWIAANSGAHRLPLTSAQDAFISGNNGLTSNFISGDLSAVYYSKTDNRIWFGSNDNAIPAVWRVDLTQPPVSITVAFSTVDALGTSARVRDIGPAGPTGGVLVATDQGLTEAADSLTFLGNVEPGGDTVRAIAVGGGRRWGGAKLIYDLDDVLAVAVDPFGSGDDQKIRALVVDEANGELWVGSDNQGIARLANDTGAMLGTFTTDDGLPSNKIRHIQVETSGPHAGDVWAATDAGVARYIRARDTWVSMGDNHGLTGFLDVRAIAIDQAAGRRAIYAGTNNGVVYIRTP